MPRSLTLPFTLRRSSDVIGMSEITSTTETVHGLLRLEAERLVVQWRRARKTDRVGGEIRTDEEVEDVREVAVPLSGLAGASVRRGWWHWLTGPKIALLASDLRAFEAVAGEGGLRLDHPAEIVFGLRRADVLAAEEFSAELTLALAQRSLSADQAGGRTLEAGGTAPRPPLPGPPSGTEPAGPHD